MLSLGNELMAASPIIVWLAFLACTAKLLHTIPATLILVCLGLTDVLALWRPGLSSFAVTAIKLLLCFVLIGYTHGIRSYAYYVLLGIVLIATRDLNRGRAVAIGILAATLYLSLLLFALGHVAESSGAIGEVFLRGVALALAGLLPSPNEERMSNAALGR